MITVSNLDIMESNTDDDFDDDWIPDSLADFVKQADMALAEHQQMFRDELSSSPDATRNQNQSVDSTEDARVSEIVRDLQFQMENVVLDEGTEESESAVATPVFKDNNPNEDNGATDENGDISDSMDALAVTKVEVSEETHEDSLVISKADLTDSGKEGTVKTEEKDDPGSKSDKLDLKSSNSVDSSSESAVEASPSKASTTVDLKPTIYQAEENELHLPNTTKVASAGSSLEDAMEGLKMEEPNFQRTKETTPAMVDSNADASTPMVQPETPVHQPSKGFGFFAKVTKGLTGVLSSGPQVQTQEKGQATDIKTEPMTENKPVEMKANDQLPERLTNIKTEPMTEDKPVEGKTNDQPPELLVSLSQPQDVVAQMPVKGVLPKDPSIATSTPQRLSAAAVPTVANKKSPRSSPLASTSQAAPTNKEDAKTGGKQPNITPVTSPVVPTSRLLQPTAAYSSRDNDDKKKASSNRGPMSPASRLTQPTAASMGHTAGTRTHQSPSNGGQSSARLGTAHSANSSKRQMRSAGTHSAVTSKRVTTTRTSGNVRSSPMQTNSNVNSSRQISSPSKIPAFMQPTASQRAHVRHSPNSSHANSSTGKRTGLTRPQVASRLMKGTAASSARKSSASPPSVLPAKRAGSEEAVARAKERIRQRRLHEAQSTFVRDTTAKFAMGTKDQEKPKPRSPRKAHGTNDGSPHFATPTTAAMAHKRTPGISMAQSGDLFGRGLRSETSPSSVVSSGKHRLTIPQGPKFATDAKYGSKKVKEELRQESEVSLAQSTNVLARTLRGPTPVLSTKRSAGLTRPQSPKFHTTHKRALPKSSAEIEEERIAQERANFRSHPYKANEKALHTGSSVGIERVRKRTLTKPKPFNLSGASPATRGKNGDESKKEQEDEDARQMKKQFVARPYPKSFSPKPKITADTKRTPTVPEPFKFSVGTSSTKTKSSRTGQTPSPRKFKARPLPKTTFKGPTIPVQNTTPASSGGGIQQITFTPNGKGMPASQLDPAKPATTPEPFNLESVQRHGAFQELLQEKVASGNVS